MGLQKRVVKTEVEFAYEEGYGPSRGGERRRKQGIGPTLDGTETVEDFLNMAEGVIEWGEARWQADHGNFDDHQLVVNTINLAMKLIPGAEALAEEA